MTENVCFSSWLKQLTTSKEKSILFTKSTKQAIKASIERGNTKLRNLRILFALEVNIIFSYLCSTRLSTSHSTGNILK